MKTHIRSTGHYLPKKIMTNHDLEKMVETNDAWIFERTGIKERRIAQLELGESPSGMGTFAALEALERAKLQPNDIDGIIFAGCLGDFPLPNTASIIQQKLGITNQCASFDIAVACSGFIYGVSLAHSLTQSKIMKRVLVVTSEMLSPLVNWEDRGTCILFGDGAAAAIIEADPQGTSGSEILAVKLGTDGSGQEFIKMPAGGALQSLTTELMAAKKNTIHMLGRELFKVAVRTLVDNALAVCEEAKIPLEDVDWFIPHQANQRIIEAVGERLGVAAEKVVSNIELLGNTSASTVPLALHQLIEAGKLKRGQTVLMDAFGAGLTSGAILLRY